MDIEEFIKLGERMKMREELAKTAEGYHSDKFKQKSVKKMSDKDALFIENEFKKDVLDRDWTKVHEILNHFKILNNSLIVHEIKL